MGKAWFRLGSMDNANRRYGRFRRRKRKIVFPQQQVLDQNNKCSENNT